MTAERDEAPFQPAVPALKSRYGTDQQTTTFLRLRNRVFELLELCSSFEDMRAPAIRCTRASMDFATVICRGISVLAVSYSAKIPKIASNSGE